ncbi:EF-hand [Glarea lozoyensis ATCC 20868]|uniref:EF-hand n=1 Tax=Glarea lozoyensis (strain ATCC 20868 / MF5171) TaxID=1116229 RepID=S3DC04_GLAL2|nr:EF-hand [Glarea lozoyensis ATCC 20868]EPE34629.1 EF-hand [Glarea lozoyensis ATCC 20868]
MRSSFYWEWYRFTIDIAFEPMPIPPKRRLKDTTSTTQPPKPRQSKLAKEHKLTPLEEQEIRSAFADFSTPKKGTKEGVLPITKVRDAMITLAIPPTPHELTEYLSILAPSGEDYAEFSSFVAICALKFHSRTRNSDTHAAEVAEAFGLFMAKFEGEEKITLEVLRGVARDIRVEVEEDVLRDMILEANGGRGVGEGVGMREFEEVGRRAGIWR